MVWITCDVFINCLDSHSDGTHSPQSIHWYASDVMLHFSKSVLMEKQNSSWMIWGWGYIQQILIFGLTIPLRPALQRDAWPIGRHKTCSTLEQHKRFSKHFSLMLQSRFISVLKSAWVNVSDTMGSYYNIKKNTEIFYLKQPNLTWTCIMHQLSKCKYCR